MNIQQVAQKIGVSVATVSRAFNAPQQVSVDTREKVLRMAKTLGYVPNASARTLRTSRSRVLGVLMPTLTNPVFAECLEGVAEAAHAAGYAILPMTTHYDATSETRCVTLMQGASVDGLLLVVSNPDSSQALRLLQRARKPYVLLYNRHPKHPCVSGDSETAVAEVVARLVSLGHRRLTMVSGPMSASDRAQQRYKGFLQGLKLAQMKGPCLLEVPFMESAVETVVTHLKSDNRPTALVCSNDLLALRCLRAAQLAGMRVPKDISIVGFDGIALGLDTMPMLTTIVQPNHEAGHLGVQWLVQALEQGKRPTPSQSVLLAHQFRAGESCGQAPAAYPSRV
ncbi:MAG: LacI family DNA-binding transcriptional regulator [Betaproteobacteria bacterium]|nr:LacI family DNA-binding transcriptional regulator [Betaproteobacteria bacterium]NBS47415.1 LacI family DNA-binding transcriptional regulator [Betaproteobacteria bacterium]